MTTGIYKRGTTWWIRYTGLDGNQIRESSKSKSFKKAEELLTKRKGTVDEGKQPDYKRVPDCTFRELAERYVLWMKGRQKGARQKLSVINQLSTVFGATQLRKFSTMMVEEFQSSRLEGGNSPATVNRLLATLKHMFTKAAEWEIVDEETLKRIRRVKLFKEKNTRLRYLSIEESQQLVKACDYHLRPIVITALNTGMRRGEILSLTWDRVDLRHGFIYLHAYGTKNGEKREIPINTTLRATLQAIPRRLDLPYVFFNPETQKPLQDVKRSFHTALRKAGIRDFKFHDLRHTFCSHLIMAGVDLTTVKELAGHKDIKMTLRYSHLAPAHKAKAVDMLDTVLNPISTKLAQFPQRKEAASLV